MADIFVKTGHGTTDMVIDCTDFKFQHATNIDLSSLMFSNYTNTATGKASIGISPHGIELSFIDVFPGSISESALTDKPGLLDWLEPEHELMPDRGFSVHEQCIVKGIFLNRPAQKSTNQFCSAEIASNFDIASRKFMSRGLSRW